jgi:hypothetical protein
MPFSGSLRAISVLFVSIALASAGCTKEEPAPDAAKGSQKPPAGAEKPADQLTAAECQQLFDHVMDVAVTEALKDMGAAELDKEVVAKLRKEMKSDPTLKKTAASCEKEYKREVYDCIMKVKTQTAITICENK